MNKLKNIGLVVASVAIVASPLMALAQSTLPPPKVVTFSDIATIFKTVAQWAFTGLIFLAIIFVIVAAFKYVTANGDPETIKKANHTLIYAAVAVAVALLANSLPTIVNTFIGTSGPPTTL